MSIQSQITADIKAAMVAKDSLRLSVLRMLKASIDNTVIEKKSPELDDPTVTALIRKNIKSRQDSVEAFTKGNRPEMAEKEKQEIQILESYLPQGLSPEAVEALVKEAISEAGATSRKDMGAVMKIASAKAAGRTDGKTLSSLVAKLLP